MLFRQDVLDGVADGRVTLAFRRRRRAPPAEGSTLRSPVGVLSLDRVAVIDEGDIRPDDVRRTGLSVDELRASIAGRERSRASSSSGQDRQGVGGAMDGELSAAGGAYGS